MQRTNVSAVLNKLCDVGKIYKIKGKPIIYTVNLTEKSEEAIKLQGSFDTLIGRNGSLKKCIQQAKASMPNPEGPRMPDNFFDNYEMPGRKMNVYRGWEIYEKETYDIAINLKENYGNIEWYISENGMGVQDEGRFIKDGRIEDNYRVDFIRDHLIWLHKAIEEGCNVKGYHMWTFIDNWSWSNAYKNRYGFIQLDLKTQKRIIKKSGYWIKEVSENNGF
ncbi:family 1 glycosylhydrolase [Clostridium magnum]